MWYFDPYITLQLKGDDKMLSHDFRDTPKLFRTQLDGEFIISILDSTRHQFQLDHVFQLGYRGDFILPMIPARG